MRKPLLIVILLLAITVRFTLAQQGTKERIKVFSHAIEGNLVGDSPERDVTVYLPPSYKVENNRHYPVIYMLHGFTDDDSR